MKKKIIILSFTLNLLMIFLILLSGVGVSVNLGISALISKSDYKNITATKSIFNLKENIKKKYYIDITDEEIIQGTLKGMLSSLPDGYSYYYTQSEIEMRRNSDKGKDILIGVMISRDNNKRYIISDVDQTMTAYEAGIRKGDILISVNDIEVNDINIAKVREILKSEEKESVLSSNYKKVTIKVSREGEEYTFIVDRKEYEDKSVEYEIIGDVAYIKITKFIKTTFKDFKNASNELKKENINKVILDLRGNGGGFVDEAVNVAGSLVGNEIIYYQTSRNEEPKENRYSGNKLYDYELVVLVDQNTASAAELLVGAIKSYNRGIVIGNTTFGKGIIQTTYSLLNKDAYQITTSEYLIPDKSKIHKIGIEPNIIIEENEDILEKVMEILNK